jgi:hypothetical protein
MKVEAYDLEFELGEAMTSVLAGLRFAEPLRTPE